jgi:hypothetical protein
MSLGFLHRDRQRLLEQDVFAASGRLQREVSMQIVGHRQQHRVDVRTVEQRLVGRIGRRRQRRPEIARHFLVRVEHRDDVDARGPRRFAGVLHADASQSDDAEPDGIDERLGLRDGAAAALHRRRNRRPDGLVRTPLKHDAEVFRMS